MEIEDERTVRVQIELDKLNANASLYDLYFFDDPGVYMPDMIVPERSQACNAQRQGILNQFIAKRTRLEDLRGFAAVSRDLALGPPLMCSDMGPIHEGDFRASLLWGMYGNPCFRGKQVMAWEAEPTFVLETKLVIYRALAHGYSEVDLSLACVARTLHLEYLVQQRWRARGTSGAGPPPTNGQPPATNGHPPTMNGHPRRTNGHHPATRRRSRTTNGRPAANSGGPNGTHRVFSDAGNAALRDMSLQTHSFTQISGANTFGDSALQDHHATRTTWDDDAEMISETSRVRLPKLTRKCYGWGPGAIESVNQPRRYRREELILLSANNLNGRAESFLARECGRMGTQSSMADDITKQEANSSVGCWQTQSSDNYLLGSTNTDESRARGPRYQYERRKSRYQPLVKTMSAHQARGLKVGLNPILSATPRL